MRSLQYKNSIALYILAIFTILVFFHSYAIPSVNTYPLQDWKISTPEMQGMRSQVLTEMMEYIEKNNFKIDSLLIVRNGYMVFDAYYYPFSNDQKHHIYSCAKSIMSALIGIAIDRGYIQNVNQPITDFFPDKALANADDLKKSITLENLLTMASGLRCGGWAGFFDMWNSDDWIQYVLDLPMAGTPGEKFEYCDGVSYLLSAIIQNTTKMDCRFPQPICIAMPILVPEIPFGHQIYVLLGCFGLLTHACAALKPTNFCPFSSHSFN